MALTRQQTASQPQISAWVEANAGTGKTKVLTDRVIRLLLAGAAPERILCLTFTKAAAAEMRNRIANRLAGWARLDDAALDTELRELGIARPRAGERIAARRLFARVLDAAGGLRIQTLHAFCEAVLKRFPLEADVAPHFDVIEDRERAELQMRARDAVWARLAAGADPALAKDFEVLQGQLAERGFDELMTSLLSGRGRFTVIAAERIDEGEVSRRLATALALPDLQTEAKERQAAARLSAEAVAELHALASALATGTGPEQANARAIERWLDADQAGRIDSFTDWLSIFFIDGGQGTPRAKLANKKTGEAYPQVLDTIAAETARLEIARRRIAGAALLAASMAAIRFARAVAFEYARAKEARAALDFDDLIRRTADLLGESGSRWVLYKLDRGLTHVLVDEAQDTSPAQWRILRELTDDFFSGEGAHETPPSVFAVGDPKQSIYSFQGAEPAGFDAQRRLYGERIAEANGEEGFAHVLLDRSYRSVAAVLSLVDAAFTGEPGCRGVTAPDTPLHHEPARAGEPGLVELWPAVPYEEPATDAPWQPQRRAGSSPEARLAVALAEHIAANIGSTTLEARGRKMRAGDIMVLVRTRTALVDALVRELKQRGIDVAGVDRMKIGEQLAVRDMLAFARVLLLPEDDLSLAEFLKGPLGGCSDDELLRLAHGRPGTLWDALKAAGAASGSGRKAASNAPVGALSLIERWRARAGYLRPYELFARLLAEGGRAALLARLGEEAGDPIDEFLTLALDYERDHAPGLQGFLHWLAAGETEIKRDLDHGRRDEVRILTVHGAKGLQAPVVYLPDTVRRPGQQKREHLHWIDGEAGQAPLWNPLASNDGGAAAGLRDDRDAAAMAEYNRLFYVALTRAEDRLVICGAENRHNRADRPECWHALARAGLARLGAETIPEAGLGLGWDGEGLRYAPGGTATRTEPAGEDAPGDGVALDGEWRDLPAPREAPALLVAPSRAGADDRDAGDRDMGESEPPPLPPLGRARAALARGRVVHRLLQYLADLEPAARAQAGVRLLARPDPDLEGQDGEALLREVLAVLEDARFAAYFAPGSRAEVPVAGRIGDVAIAGQIDRLAVTGTAVHIIDYKTNRPPPNEEAGVPVVYLRQMAAYRALLQRIYPQKTVRCALLWTAGPEGAYAMELSETALSRHAPDAG